VDRGELCCLRLPCLQMFLFHRRLSIPSCQRPCFPFPLPNYMLIPYFFPSPLQQSTLTSPSPAALHAALHFQYPNYFRYLSAPRLLSAVSVSKTCSDLSVACSWYFVFMFENPTNPIYWCLTDILTCTGKRTHFHAMAKSGAWPLAPGLLNAPMLH